MVLTGNSESTSERSQLHMLVHGVFASANRDPGRMAHQVRYRVRERDVQTILWLNTFASAPQSVSISLDQQIRKVVELRLEEYVQKYGQHDTLEVNRGERLALCRMKIVKGHAKYEKGRLPNTEW